MEPSRRLLDYYLPPGDGFVLESLIATTYQVDFEFLEEELLASALGVRSPVSRLKAFRSELERKLQKAEVSVLYDLGGCERLARLSPRIDAIPVSSRKLHSKVSLVTWIRETSAIDTQPDRRIRLIVGSANLTRQGFRSNYECVVSLDFGGKGSSARNLLTTAIGSVRQIGAGTLAPQLSRQLTALEAHVERLPVGGGSPDVPVAFVTAGEVVQTIRSHWTSISDRSPETVTVVSPFWAEGATADATLVDLFQSLGPATNLELVCRGEKSPDGKSWLPVFDGCIAAELKTRLSSRIYLRAALPDADGDQSGGHTDSEMGDELEENELATRLGTEFPSAEVQRALHAKMIRLDGKEGSVLYVGSSNCTRRGLGLGGPSNFEAGLVYRLPARHRKHVAELLGFAGPPCEVYDDSLPTTIQPSPSEQVFVPSFLAEVVASGTLITIKFRTEAPRDLVLLMPIPANVEALHYWMLHRAESPSESSPNPITVDISTCTQCDDRLEVLAIDPPSDPILPHVFIEVRWENHSATFPVRFDDKTRLPLLLVGRKPTEGEIIDYFLFGTEPDEGDGNAGLPGSDSKKVKSDAPIDTRRILSYFIRRFVQAIPGIEAEIRRAAYSRASLDAALRGPTSPLELAERTFASLTQLPKNDEPQKTPIAVGFQLAELIAALGRCRKCVVDPELKACFDPVVARCRGMLDSLVGQHIELQAQGFQLYQTRILGDIR